MGQLVVIAHLYNIHDVARMQIKMQQDLLYQRLGGKNLRLDSQVHKSLSLRLVIEVKGLLLDPCHEARSRLVFGIGKGYLLRSKFMDLKQHLPNQSVKIEIEDSYSFLI